jgi:hypothetical protein
LAPAEYCRRNPRYDGALMDENSDGDESRGPALGLRERRSETLIQTIVGGTDASGNGTVSWEDNAGGLGQRAQHMQFTAEGKGMA